MTYRLVLSDRNGSTAGDPGDRDTVLAEFDRQVSGMLFGPLTGWRLSVMRAEDWAAAQAIAERSRT